MGADAQSTRLSPGSALLHRERALQESRADDRGWGEHSEKQERVSGKEAPLESSRRGLPEGIRITAKLSRCPFGEYLGRVQTAMNTRMPVAEPACTILFSISVARA